VGGVKTRFKYKKVGEADFGLQDDEILLLEDKQLNRLVSLKKYRPYHEQDTPVNLHRIRNLKKGMEKELEAKKELLK